MDKHKPEEAVDNLPEAVLASGNRVGDLARGYCRGKSSTHVSDIYVEDMEFQNYVLIQSGIKIKRILNMHIDNTSVFHDHLDINGFV